MAWGFDLATNTRMYYLMLEILIMSFGFYLFLFLFLLPAGSVDGRKMLRLSANSAEASFYFPLIAQIFANSKENIFTISKGQDLLGFFSNLWDLLKLSFLVEQLQEKFWGKYQESWEVRSKLILHIFYNLWDFPESINFPAHSSQEYTREVGSRNHHLELPI